MSTYRVLYNMTSRFMDPAEVVDLGDYKEITVVEANQPDDVFRMMNAIEGIELCCQLRVRSFSVGDLLQDVATGKITGCCGCGWKEVRDGAA